MRLGNGSIVLLAASLAAAQTQAPGWRQVEDANAAPAKPAGLTVAAGTRVPLVLINSVSTKHSVEGDRIYLQTAFPILVENRIVIPPGSYVEGTVTEVKRPGRVKGRGEMYLRFDSLILPNGVRRDFGARIGGMDGNVDESVDKSEGKVKGASNKAGDARTVAETTAAGASVGSIAGAAAGRPGLGIGTGAAAGAAAGLMAVLLTRGPDVVLARGTTVEMVLDRPLIFDERELDFSHAATPMPIAPPPAPAATKSRGLGWPL
jgi:type IV secretion system protein VirB10